MDNTTADVTQTTEISLTTIVASGDLLELLSAEQRRTNLVVVALLASVTVVGLVGNALVVVVYRPCCSGLALSPATVFILAMAGLDLGICLLTVPYEILDLLRPYDNDNVLLCRTVRSLTTLMGYCRGLMLLCVACDRYLKVCVPFFTYTSTPARLVVLGATLLSTALAWPQGVINDRITIATHKPGVFGTDCGIDPTIPGLYSLLYHAMLYAVFAVCFAAYGGLYGRIFFVLWRKGCFSSSKHSNTKVESLKKVIADPYSRVKECRNIENLNARREISIDKSEHEESDSKCDLNADCVFKPSFPENKTDRFKEVKGISSAVLQQNDFLSEKSPSSKIKPATVGTEARSICLSNSRHLLRQNDLNAQGVDTERSNADLDPKLDPRYTEGQGFCKNSGSGEVSSGGRERDDGNSEACEDSVLVEWNAEDGICRRHVVPPHARGQEMQSGSRCPEIHPLCEGRSDAAAVQNRETAFPQDNPRRGGLEVCNERSSEAELTKAAQPEQQYFRHTQSRFDQNVSLLAKREPFDLTVIRRADLNSTSFSDRVHQFDGYRLPPPKPVDTLLTIKDDATSVDTNEPSKSQTTTTATTKRSFSFQKLPIKKAVSEKPADAKENNRPPGGGGVSGKTIRRHGGRRLCLSKTTLMLAAVTLTAVLGYVPYLTVVVLRTAGIRFTQDTSSTGEIIYMICVRSFLLNSLVNPIVYYVVNHNFRQRLHAAMGRLCCSFCWSPGNHDHVQPNVTSSRINIVHLA